MKFFFFNLISVSEESFLGKSLKTAVVLGSGGHTTEMFKLLSGTNMDVYRPREYIVAETDAMSLQKIKQFESSLVPLNVGRRQEPPLASEETSYKVHKIYRSRHVGQSYFSSVLTTLLAILYAVPLMIRIKPRVLLVNGPGTCVPCCLIVFIFSRLLRIMPKCKIVFVESICRVNSLSLTGKIFYHLRLTDSFMVQWKELKHKYPRTTYMGRLV